MRKKIYFSCFILLSQITSCYQSKKEVDFISSSTYIFSSVNCFEDSIEWGDILEQKDEEYFAYIYSETCYYCNIIKPKICHFCGEIDEKMYFIKFDESIPIGANFDDVIGADSLEKLFIKGTPTLFLINKRKVKEAYCGYDEIADYITSY